MQTRVARLHGEKDIRVETQISRAGTGEVLLAMAAAASAAPIFFIIRMAASARSVRETDICGHEASPPCAGAGGRR